MAETALTVAAGRPSYETADGRFDEDRLREFVEDYDGPEDPDYPGCVPIPMTRARLGARSGDGTPGSSRLRCDRDAATAGHLFVLRLAETTISPQTLLQAAQRGATEADFWSRLRGGQLGTDESPA